MPSRSVTVTHASVPSASAFSMRLDFERDVEDQLLLDCIDVAEQAPTGIHKGSRRWMIVRDQDTMTQLAGDGQLALRYVNPDGTNGRVPYPYNPNGSDDNIAGICDASGCVFGLMPHPERFIDRTQHPRWTRLPADTQADGLKLFQNAVSYFN